MKQLAGASVGEDALRTLWMQRLPTRVQEVLTIIDDAGLERLTKVADKTMERSTVEMAAITERTHAKRDAMADARDAGPAWQDGDLAAITKRLLRIEARLTRRDRSSNRHRFYRRKRSNSRDNSAERNGLCYYHHKFAEESWKCRKPCNWV
uniref:uncharacterized protein LOC117602917 n=1 Tax=Osmia lignaria TaxID=473952 RepID=UPI001478AA40|nr:uncharacterized protein LOC117602917 [Osmia lignaria]